MNRNIDYRKARNYQESRIENRRKGYLRESDDGGMGVAEEIANNVRNDATVAPSKYDIDLSWDYNNSKQVIAPAKIIVTDNAGDVIYSKTIYWADLKDRDNFILRTEEEILSELETHDFPEDDEGQQYLIPVKFAEKVIDLKFESYNKKGYENLVLGTFSDANIKLLKNKYKMSDDEYYKFEDDEEQVFDVEVYIVENAGGMMETTYNVFFKPQKNQVHNMGMLVNTDKCVFQGSVKAALKRDFINEIYTEGEDF